MKPAEALYRRWISDVWGRNDATATDEIVSRDLVDHDAMPGLPPGRAGHDLVVQAVRTAFPDAEFQIDVVMTDGDLVSGRWTMTGTHTGHFLPMNLAPTGKRVRITGQEIMRVANGRFVEIWHAVDERGLAMQLAS